MISTILKIRAKKVDKYSYNKVKSTSLIDWCFFNINNGFRLCCYHHLLNRSHRRYRRCFRHG
jgi:hypothetical protein